MKMRFAIVASSVLVAGCADGLPGLRPLTYAEPAEARTLVSFNDCKHYNPEDRALPALASTVLLGVASKALENFGTALTNGAAGGKLPASTSTSNFETPVGIMPKCVMVVRGNFAGEGESGTQIDGNWQPNPSAEEGADLEPLPVVTDLHHYVELQILSSSDGSALTFAPVHTDVRVSMDGTRTRGLSRDLSIALAFNRPGKAETGGVVVLGDREIGDPHTYRAINGRYLQEAGWFTSFAVPPEKGDNVTSMPIPVTAKTTVVESRPSKEFLAFVASVFGGSVQPFLDSRLKSELDPTQIEKEAQASFDVSAKFASSYGDAVKSLVEYCSIDDSSESKRAERASKSALARSSQIKANKAAFEADLDRPYGDSDLVEVSMNPVQEVNQQACSKL